MSGQQGPRGDNLFLNSSQGRRGPACPGAAPAPSWPTCARLREARLAGVGGRLSLDVKQVFVQGHLLGDQGGPARTQNSKTSLSSELSLTGRWECQQRGQYSPLVSTGLGNARCACARPWQWAVPLALWGA